MKDNRDLYSVEMLSQWTRIAKMGLFADEQKFLNKYLFSKNKNSIILEGGTGAGRIAFSIEKKGYNNISAFDYVPNMVASAKSVAFDLNSNVEFTVADANNLLHIEDKSVDVVIYMQQLLSIIPDQCLENTLNEVKRVLKPNGYFLISLLNYNSRSYNPLLSSFLKYLRLIRGHHHNKYKLPWLKFDGKINPRAFSSEAPTVTWYTKDMIINLFYNSGFSLENVYESSDFADVSHWDCYFCSLTKIGLND